MNTPKKANEQHVKRGVTFFWLVPIIAVALSVYLFYQTIQGEGTTIEITFTSAKDLVPNKTELHFHGVKVGIVKHVALSEDFKSVVVLAQLDRFANKLAVAGTQFWIVHPEIGMGGVSGLDTLISGNYIQVQEGTGEPTTKFAGLRGPPAVDPMSPDLFVVLEATKMPSVGMDSPIIYRNVKVGKVEDMHYDLEKHKAYVDVRIWKEYRDLVRQDTHFWNTSGIDVSMGLSGVTVRSDSLSSVLFGSITLGIPDALLATSPTVDNGAVFPLYDTIKQVISKEADAINKTQLKIGRVLTLRLKEGNGLSPEHTEVRYRGVKIGSVISMELAPDFNGVLAKVLLIPDVENFAPSSDDTNVQGFAKSNTHFVLVWPQVKVKDLSRIQVTPEVVEGPYFRAEPGGGAPCTEFTVTEIDNDSYRPIEGLVLKLEAPQVGVLRAGAPIYYRGVAVGQVERSSLADNSTTVQIRAVVRPQYTSLVRANSKFWNSTGIMSNISIWGGVKVKTQPLGDTLEGSVSFATPDNAKMGSKVSSGAVFALADKSEEEWLKWQPTIALDR